MTFEIKMGADGILKIKLSGDLDNGLVKNLRREYSQYIDASTPENPLLNLFLVKDLGKLSSATRQYLIELNSDSRYGYSAFVQPSRRARIFGQMIRKAAGRDKIHFFEDEDQARKWLKSFENY